MLLFEKYFRIYWLASCAILLCQMGTKTALSQLTQAAGASYNAQPISVVIWTDRQKYLPRDSVKLNVSLQNTGGASVYVERRMFWTGYGGGLKLEISDEHGKPVHARILSDAIMPPP